jgi:hypothetical protein
VSWYHVSTPAPVVGNYLLGAASQTLSVLVEVLVMHVVRFRGAEAAILGLKEEEVWVLALVMQMKASETD